MVNSYGILLLLITAVSIPVILGVVYLVTYKRPKEKEDACLIETTKAENVYKFVFVQNGTIIKIPFLVNPGVYGSDSIMILSDAYEMMRGSIWVTFNKYSETHQNINKKENENDDPNDVKWTSHNNNT